MQGKEYAIKDNMVQIPVRDYKRMEALLKRVEDMADERALNKALDNIEEYFPQDVVKAIVIDGESPVKVYRNYRGMTQKELGQKVGVSQATVGEIETGRKEGSLKTMVSIASALNVDLEDLI